MSPTPNEKDEEKSEDGKKPTGSTESKTCRSTLLSLFNEVESMKNPEKTASQAKRGREDSTKEQISRGSCISSSTSQSSRSPGYGSSVSTLSSSTPRSTRSVGTDKDLSSSTVGAESNAVTKSPNLSALITPENTPNKFSSPCVLTNRRPFKRSFDEASEQSPISTPNNSTFDTPESSPNGHGSSAKRFKTSWNDSRSWLSSPDESLTSSPRSRFGGISDNDAIQPELIGYQLVGDSQFCRFGQQLLGLQRVYMPNSSGRIGICVSGQTITDLHKRVKEKFYPISEKIILMIGTNDFLRNVDVKTMCKELASLITTLQETTKNIVLLTLPPIPKLEKKQRAYHFTLLNQYNTFIRSLDNNDRLRIADVSPLYMTSTPFQKCRMNFFELYFNGPQQRLDMIHLNQAGLEVIRKWLAADSPRIPLNLLPIDNTNQQAEKVEEGDLSA